MRIGILTQPFYANYGGILQNYALQQVLKNMGVEVWTLDYGKQSWLNWADKAWRVIILKMLGQKAYLDETPTKKRRKEMPLRHFVNNYIRTTEPRTRKVERRVVEKYAFDALIVGSDQVWRPIYNCCVEDCFLKFLSGLKAKRIAYAASFGTEDWEFTQQQTEECAALAKRFDAISVREKSGVDLCKNHLGVSATHVLDPTLLLSAEDYMKLCEDIPKHVPFIFAYVLDESEEKKRNIKEFAESQGLPYLIKGSDDAVRDNDTIELWLSYFRDAAFVITDSFHGMVFSIVFNKNFYVFGNKKRGNSRFISLLDLFGLEDRMIDELTLKNPSQIDWKVVNDKKEKAILRSRNWLKKCL